MSIIYLRSYKNGTGNLIPLEIEKEYPTFRVKRLFYAYGFEPGELRGEHAHYTTNQLLICLQGKVHVELFDGKVIKKYLLVENTALFVPKGIWDSELYITGKEILLVLSDTEYDRSDYIEDPQKYLEYANQHV